MNKFAQVKVYDNKYYIYCPGMNYYLEKRKVVCPNKVFVLPIEASFTLNNVEYVGSVLSIVYHQAEDPLFVEKTNWHLSPHVNWDNLTQNMVNEWDAEVKKLQWMFNVEDLTGQTVKLWHVLVYAKVFAIIAIIIGCGVYYRNKKNKTVENTDTVEIELSENASSSESQGRHHHNIVIAC